MKKIFYEKVGRRYRPVAEYDNELLDSFGKGTHLVMCYPGGQSRRYNITPNHAALIAGARVAEDAMCKAINQAVQMRHDEYNDRVLTNEQHAAWEHFVEVMGERGRYVKYSSVRDIADAGIQAIVDEAAELMKNSAVKQAYEQFLLVCELTKQQEK